MRIPTCFAACAAALLGMGCADRPPDGGSFPVDPVDGSVYNLHVTHHSMQGDATIAAPNGSFLTATDAVWTNECGIDVANFQKDAGVVMGQNLSGSAVRLGQRYDWLYSNGDLITSNISALEAKMARRTAQVNKGSELFYSHFIWGGSGVAVDGITFGPTRRLSVVESAQQCTSAYCIYVPAHEMGHQMNLAHRKQATPANFWTMDENGSVIGANLEGQQVTSGQTTYTPQTECYIARRHGLYNQFFVQPRPAGMMP